MLIRRRIEKLERTIPTTIERLIERVEREAMSQLSQDQQRMVNGRGNGHIDEEHSAAKHYQESLSSALKQVSDDDLDRMILFYEPNPVHAGFRP